VLLLYHNDLSGTIPTELAAVTTLTTVLIHNNRLTGRLSNLLNEDLLLGESCTGGSCKIALSVFDFSRNEFTGSLPESLFQLAT
jgi:hypothetical protein